jgi:transcriptional regulator with XRE-family HTH domain
MALDKSSFGSVIASARKEQKLSQKELAERILKEDGQPITPQYLNDIEHGRRSPSSDYLVRQFAKVLKHSEVTVDLLTALAGVLTEEDRKLVQKADPRQVEQAFHAFRQTLRKK